MSRIAKSQASQERLAELQSQRAELAAELDRLEDEVPKLREQLAEARESGSKWRTPSGTVVENEADVLARELSGRLSAQDAHRGDLPKLLDELDRQIVLLERLAAADQEISAAIQDIATAGQETAALQAKQDQIAGRINAMEEEISTALAAAEAAEQAAAAAIAGAEDAKAEKSARAQLDKAVELSLATDAAARMKRRAIDALAAEAAILTQRIDACDQRIGESEKQAGDAVFLKLSEQWNQAVEELRAIGVRLAAADRIRDGHRLVELRKLELPLLGSGYGLSIGRYDLLEAAEEASITLNELASA